MPYFSLFEKFYDLFVPLIIYLGLFRSTRESIPVILALGFVMDNLSGSPLGLYLTTYVWLFVSVRWIITVLQVKDSILLPFVVAAGVLMQNIIFIGTMAMSKPGPGFFSTVLGTVAVQLLWALLTGPIFLFIVNYFHQSWDRWIAELLDFKSNQA
ncbi:MAG: hypothetical protein KKH68_13255 [Proteobacteria bacterium]|nr:hypothetical protein [Pseudomonadota bacterium]